MATKSKPPKLSPEERERILRLRRKFETRFTIARNGKESLDAGDYGNAVRKFVDYLSVLSEIHEVKEIYDLKVQMFDPKKDLTELLMISHIFFEMARMYDAVPKFQEDAQKCLNQFVHFSANQPYQVVNSEMVRKFIKKSTFKNPEIFKAAYSQILIQSKKCYIVTFCYSDQDSITHDYREFKDWLLNFRLGMIAVGFYYRLSSRTVDKYQHHLGFRYLSYFMMRPVLLLFSKTLLPVIIKKC